MIIYFVEKRTTIHCGRLFLSKVNHCISFFFKANTGQNDINGTEMYYIFHFNLNFKFPLFKLLLISEFCESCMQLIAIAFAYGTFEQNTFEQSTFVGKNRLYRMISFFPLEMKHLNGKRVSIVLLIWPSLLRSFISFDEHSKP